MSLPLEKSRRIDQVLVMTWLLFAPIAIFFVIIGMRDEGMLDQSAHVWILIVLNIVLGFAAIISGIHDVINNPVIKSNHKAYWILSFFFNGLGLYVYAAIHIVPRAFRRK
jgi:hypothetical protein